MNKKDLTKDRPECVLDSAVDGTVICISLPKQESNLSKCTGCQGIKTRIQNGKQPDNINKRWVDEHGKNWNGRRCPDCAVKGMKSRMQKLRLERKDENVQ